MSALHVEFSPVMFNFRGYTEPGGFEAHRPYALIGSVLFVGNHVASLFATHGDLEVPTIREIFRWLLDQGIYTATVNRHGDEKTWDCRRWLHARAAGGADSVALHLHFDPVMYAFKVHAAPRPAPAQSLPMAQGTAFIFNGGNARVFCNEADLGPAEIKAVTAEIANLGVHTVLSQRHGIEQIWKNEGGRIRAAKA